MKKLPGKLIRNQLLTTYGIYEEEYDYYLYDHNSIENIYKYITDLKSIDYSKYKELIKILYPIFYITNEYKYHSVSDYFYKSDSNENSKQEIEEEQDISNENSDEKLNIKIDEDTNEETDEEIDEYLDEELDEGSTVIDLRGEEQIPYDPYENVIYNKKVLLELLDSDDLLAQIEDDPFLLNLIIESNLFFENLLDQKFRLVTKNILLKITDQKMNKYISKISPYWILENIYYTQNLTKEEFIETCASQDIETYYNNGRNYFRILQLFEPEFFNKFINSIYIDSYKYHHYLSIYNLKDYNNDKNIINKFNNLNEDNIKEGINEPPLFEYLFSGFINYNSNKKLKEEIDLYFKNNNEPIKTLTKKK